MISSIVGALAHPAWNCIRFLLLFSVFTLTVLGQNSAWALEVQAIKLGFGGHWKVGHWVPVEIEFQAQQSHSGQVVLTVPDGETIATRIVSPLQTIEAGNSKLTAFAKIGRANPTITVTFEEKGQVLVEQIFTPTEVSTGLLSTQELILLVGAAETFDLPVAGRAELGRTVIARIASLADLPQASLAYDTVDQVVVLTHAVESFAGLDRTSPQAAGLYEWIRLGGRLVLSAGANSPEAFAQDAALTLFTPGEFVEMAPFRQSGILESYAETNEPLPGGTGSRSARTIPVPRFGATDGVSAGTLEAYEGSLAAPLPIITRNAAGFGQITLIGLDLEQSLITDWPARNRLMNRLLGRTSELRRHSEPQRLGQVVHVGYTDLTGQLRAVLDRFSGVRSIAFWQITALLFLFILLIGPGDYFLLKWLKKPEWTWVSFPLLVVLFGAGTVVWAWQSKGHQLRVNQAEVIDVDLATSHEQGSLIRSTTWGSIFSPETEQYDLRIDRPDDVQFSLLSWLGLPGSALGGMDGAAPVQIPFQQPYTIEVGVGEMTRFPISNWSTAHFTGRWHQQSAERALASSLLTQQFDRDSIMGSIRNDSQQSFEDCYLFYGRWVYPLGTLPAGGAATLSRQSEAQTVETFLTQRRLSDTAQGYNLTNSADISRVLQVMLFHQAAGGQGYTQLANRYTHVLDLSTHLTSGQAILLAKGPSQSSLQIAGHPLDAAGHEKSTFYRFIMPVTVQK